MRAGAAIDHDIGLSVGRVAGFRQFFQNVPRILAAQQGPRVPAGDAFGQDIQIDAQPDGHGAILDQAARLVVHERAAASGQNTGAVINQAGNDLAFAVAEMRLSEFVENLAHRAARRLLYFLVRVIERHTQPFRQTPADRGLARAH